MDNQNNSNYQQGGYQVPNYSNYQQKGYLYPNNQQIGNPYGYMQQKQTSGLAIASMVLGIIALVTSCFGVTGIICGALAIIFGGLALLSHKAGKGMAITGLVCGIVALIPAIYFVSAATSIMSMF